MTCPHCHGTLMSAWEFDAGVGFTSEPTCINCGRTNTTIPEATLEQMRFENTKGRRRTPTSGGMRI